jgi:hypothetical protein
MSSFDLRILEAIRKHWVHHVELIAVVEPERELVQVQRQIFCGDLTVNPHDPALEQGPNVLTTVV